MTCVHCADLQIAVETLATAVEQLTAGNTEGASQSITQARYWLR